MIVQIKIVFRYPAQLDKQSREFEQILALLRDYLVDQFKESIIVDAIENSTEVMLMLNNERKVVAFSLYEVSQIDLVQSSQWLPVDSTLLYCSTKFVRLDFQRRGLGTEMTNQLIDRYLPHCYCATSPLVEWVSSTQKLLAHRGYESFSPLSRQIPKEVFLAAKTALTLGNRASHRLTRELIRRDVYDEEESKILTEDQILTMRVPLRATDGMMLVAFRSLLLT